MSGRAVVIRDGAAQPAGYISDTCLYGDCDCDMPGCLCECHDGGCDHDHGPGRA